MLSRSGPKKEQLTQKLHQCSIISASSAFLSEQKSSGELKEGVKTVNAKEFSESRSENGVKAPSIPSSSRPWGALTDASFEAMREIYNNGSTVLKGKAGIPKKQGVLSARAASMLEAERDSPKKWSPIVEMHYRGGVYRGRCQGGLPEGKGRLVLGDGNIYDGMWRYGKRSGVGTFYFSNGDVFQGSWRDDLMHGKGWFYFHAWYFCIAYLIAHIGNPYK
ncbi:hypothetical protein F3Y22_tig00112428pilonHSYRG00056 [Hibiscus syriacus]|uniref:Uncharacterized protein n=1 Tax=Hibiscus syriacus TaxID=106335 RepID=A0A6A2WZP8_HIBSY|nr:hypothetical protein F3Y22_tig00112428pilonHSYRG00056 [Hibiscus syriacus]